MYKIKIDTSNRYEKSAELVFVEKDSEKVIAGEVGDIDIIPAIKEILEKNGLKITDISEFIANPGPGSFTGLKMGVTAINVLNWALGKKKITELSCPNYGGEPNISLPKDKL